MAASGTRGMKVTFWAWAPQASLGAYAVKLLRSLGYRASLKVLSRTRYFAVADDPRTKAQIGFYFTTEIYHSVLDLHGLREVGAQCKAALKRFDFKAMAEAIPDALVDEIAIACTPDEARDRLAQWKDLTGDPLLYAPSVGVPPERIRANVEFMFEVFGSRK